MKAGALRHRCWILTPTHANSAGTVTTTWGTTTVCWASLEPIRGREWYESHMAENAEITARVRMRYVANLAPTMRLSFNSRTFDIVSIINPGERNRELEIMVNELVES